MLTQIIATVLALHASKLKPDPMHYCMQLHALCCYCCTDLSSAERRIQGAAINLLQGIWYHIHSLMPLRDAARVACVSHSFLSSWRCHPNLNLTLNLTSEALGLNNNASENDESARIFYIKANRILEEHSGIGVKKLKIEIPSYCSAKDKCFLDGWLQTAVTPGIEELILILEADYNLPCSLLSNGNGDSIRYLHLAYCSFHPTVTLGCFRSLKRLYLCRVDITDTEIGCLLSHSFALERLEIRDCDKIVCLKVPCLLQRLSYLEVFGCPRLKLIDNEAPNLSSFSFEGYRTVRLSLKDTLQLKYLYIQHRGSVHWARYKLPSWMPNLEALTIFSSKERVNTPMLCSKFIHLRHLNITLHGIPFSPAYDYVSLVSFFDAAPSLETFNLNVFQQHMEHLPMFTDPADLRQTRQLCHHNLKSVKITGFYVVKSLVELIYHIIESIASLECLTLEVPQSSVTCRTLGNRLGKCYPMSSDKLMEARRAILAIRTYIVPKVPTTVELHVVEPCSRCHDFKV